MDFYIVRHMEADFGQLSDSFLFEMNQYFPNLQEVLYYDSIYALVLKEGNGSFGGKSAVAFLKKSELSMEEIKTVWYL